jgi:hypothetical protein
LEAAVNLIHKAAKNESAGSRVAQVSALLGKPGEKNGVFISGNLAKPSNLGEATRTASGIHIGINFKSLSDSNRLGSVVMHEGSHGVDLKNDETAERMVVNRSRSALNVSEIKAGGTQAEMFKALGRDEPFGLYSERNGIDWDEIHKQADRSVKQQCQTAGECSP